MLGFTSTKDSAFTEKEQRLVQSSNFVLTTNFQSAYVSGVAMQCTSSSLRKEGTALYPDCTPSLCSRSANHVHKSQSQRFVIDALDGNAAVAYSFTGAVTAYTAYAVAKYSPTGAGAAKVTAAKLLLKPLLREGARSAELAAGVLLSALWLA